MVTPANELEAALLQAAGGAGTDGFLSQLLLARVLLPAPAGLRFDVRPGDPDFPWAPELVSGVPHQAVYTSQERLGDRPSARVKFARLIGSWPDAAWSLSLNPGTPFSATLPGEQVVALAGWAAEVGLTGEGETGVMPVPPAAPPGPTMMAKPLTRRELEFYLERGYDRVAGFVYRRADISHLTTAQAISAAVGREFTDCVLTWAAHREDLYRIPYGGRDEQAMIAIEGWVIERAPFRGSGFAPGESGDVIPEFKVDSARLPHGATIGRLSGELIATFDADTDGWRR
ncbi:SseB family protein [Longispora albida]|uniref:SseB family protein n=1 Tax=Longispora albida TaxID=203523 RepID=UPI0012FB416F|nr:SseB family protein [Longispora albida]